MKRQPMGRLVLICAGWAAVVLLFASQWYLYDSSRGQAYRFVFYIWWSCYMWTILTPVVLWFGSRFPIESGNWRRMIPVHLAVGLALTCVQISIEATLGWLRGVGHFTFPAALRHYFSQHTQLSLITYWALVAAAQFYRIHDQSRRRQIRAAQLEAHLAEARLNVLRMQLRPHFLFNTLQATTTLIHEDPAGAEEMLLSLSNLLRVSLDELDTQEIPLSRELRFLQDYMDIERRRFGERLDFEVHVDADAARCAVPTLILQPIVENAIRHGVGKHKEKDVVSISARRQDDQLALEVCNSTGVLEVSADRLLSSGIGLSNTRARLAQLYGPRHFLDLRSINPRGVCVVLSIPARQAHATPETVRKEMSA
jgi:hypothetical protein